MTPEALRMSAPCARVSRSALERNIARALESDPRGAVDLRRDACGHGARVVAEAARVAGATGAVVDDGAETYGLSSGAPALPLEAVFGLEGRGEPAMTFAAPVLQTKRLRRGEGVSYGYRYHAPSDTRVALVSGGYAQGVARALGSADGRPAAAIMIHGQECPIIGRVAMDVCVVDVSTLPVEARDEAVFFGIDAPGMLGRWADETGWTEIELAAMAGLRARREVVA